MYRSDPLPLSHPLLASSVICSISTTPPPSPKPQNCHQPQCHYDSSSTSQSHSSSFASLSFICRKILRGPSLPLLPLILLPLLLYPNLRQAQAPRISELWKGERQPPPLTCKSPCYSHARTFSVRPSVLLFVWGVRDQTSARNSLHLIGASIVFCPALTALEQRWGSVGFLCYTQLAKPFSDLASTPTPHCPGQRNLLRFNFKFKALMFHAQT